MRIRKTVLILPIVTFLACGGPSREELIGSTPEPLTTAICPVGSNVIVGTSGDDVLVGTPGKDCVLAGPGNDTVLGGDGDDDLFGESGNDTLDGEGGNDALWGGSGDDTLRGGEGNDQAFGLQGNDDISGGNGNDDVGGGPGDDVVRGEAGNDNVYGHDGNDIISGGDGEDSMWGGAGDDDISAGDGRDNIKGGRGADVIDTGAGNDRADGNEECDILDGAPEPECNLLCGDGILDESEGCEDGNVVSGDGCSSTCVTEFCGDGVLQGGLGELCDDGNSSNADQCLNNCVPAQRILSESTVRPGSVIRRAIDQGNTAYLATGPGGMECLDITDPTSTILLGQYTEPGLDCTDLIKDPGEDIAYVACGPSGVKCVNVANPAAPTLIGTIPSQCTTLTRQGNALYCGVGNDVEVWDISNPFAPQLIRTLFSGNSSGIVRIVVDQGRIYCLFRDGTIIVNDGDAFNPSFVITFGGPGNATDLVVLNGIAYCGYDGAGLFIVDFRDLSNRLVLFSDGGSPTIGLAVRNGVLSCIYADGRFLTAGLRDLTNPQILGGAWSSGLTAVSVFASGYAFCAAGATATFLDVPPFVLHTSPLGGSSGICASAGIETRFSFALDPISSAGLGVFTGGGINVPVGNVVVGAQINSTPSSPLAVGTYEIRSTNVVRNIRGTLGAPFTGTFDVAPVCTDFSTFPTSVFGGASASFGWDIFGGGATSSGLFISTDPNPASPFVNSTFIPGAPGPGAFGANWVAPIVGSPVVYYAVAQFVSGGQTYYGPVRAFTVVPGCPLFLGDCNGDGTCETQLASNANCGACGAVCAAGSTCTFSPVIGIFACACDSGFADCNSDGVCETTLGTDADCASCGDACGSGNSCIAGACVPSCPTGIGDCDNNGTCETQLASNSNCGACGVACGVGSTCTQSPIFGTFSCVCDLGFGDCDGDGVCETALGTDANCASCGDACGAGSSCLAGACVPSGNGATICGTPNLFISDGGSGIDTLVVPDLGQVQDIDVYVKLSTLGANMQDYTIRLVRGPLAQALTQNVTPQTCFGQGMDVTFDQSAATSVVGVCNQAPTPGIDGVRRPVGSLDFYNGGQTAGDWILSLSDLTINGRTGVLEEWCLVINGGTPTAPCNAIVENDFPISGTGFQRIHVQFDGLSVGSHHVEFQYVGFAPFPACGFNGFVGPSGFDGNQDNVTAPVCGFDVSAGSGPNLYGFDFESLGSTGRATMDLETGDEDVPSAFTVDGAACTYECFGPDCVP
ncbi:MAG: hypothetical protein HY791_23665 [Deltaproteobacteria bacterium]|nr:hypothetical protein [Deltaproteobacteria bacterium]